MTGGSTIERLQQLETLRLRLRGAAETALATAQTEERRSTEETRDAARRRDRQRAEADAFLLDQLVGSSPGPGGARLEDLLHAAAERRAGAVQAEIDHDRAAERMASASDAVRTAARRVQTARAEAEAATEMRLRFARTLARRDERRADDRRGEDAAVRQGLPRADWG